MFLGDSETPLQGGRLRIGRIFRSGKRRRIMTRRGCYSATRGEEYELTSHFDEGYCDKEEGYQLI